MLQSISLINMEKELLRKLGEETLYSAKGHFKACDLRRNMVTTAIWACLVTSILDIMNIVPNDIGFDAIGLFGAIALLIWNAGEGKDYRAKHKEAAEKYLALHKEIRSCFYLSDCKGNMWTQPNETRQFEWLQRLLPGLS